MRIVFLHRAGESWPVACFAPGHFQLAAKELSEFTSCQIWAVTKRILSAFIKNKIFSGFFLASLDFFLYKWRKIIHMCLQVRHEVEELHQPFSHGLGEETSCAVVGLSPIIYMCVSVCVLHSKYSSIIGNTASPAALTDHKLFWWHNNKVSLFKGYAF